MNLILRRATTLPLVDLAAGWAPGVGVDQVGKRTAQGSGRW
jgi:hypothetical protein